MTEEERWGKVRQIVREELDGLEQRLLAALSGKKTKVGLANGKFTGITEDYLCAMGEAYPAVNVAEEIKKAAAWIFSNPQTAPKSNYTRFLNSWLARCQDRAAIRAIPSRDETVRKLRSMCKYCMKPASGVVGGIAHCPDHMEDAMDGKQAVA